MMDPLIPTPPDNEISRAFSHGISLEGRIEDLITEIRNTLQAERIQLIDKLLEETSKLLTDFRIQQFATMCKTAFNELSRHFNPEEMSQILLKIGGERLEGKLLAARTIIKSK